MNQNPEKNHFLVYFFMATTVLSFIAGFYYGGKEIDESLISKSPEKQANQGKQQNLQQDDFQDLNQALTVLDKKYIKELPDKEQLKQGAIGGLVDSLDDPYTLYLNQEESQDFLTDMEGSFEGIGAEIGIRDEIITVIAPLDGMPAQKAGLKAGDKILKIDDQSTADMNLDEAVKNIRGPKGTKVKLTLYREDNGAEPLEIEIERATIDIKSVEWELKENVAYIKISGFLEDTEEEFAQAAQEIRESEAEKIILDLRNNPGGYLNTAVDLAGYFLEKGSLVVEEDYGEDNQARNRKDFATGDEELLDYPIVVLINKGTASAAEILAGSIRDNRGVKLIGEKSFGKGSVQELEPLESGGSIKVTVANWLTPDGVNLNEDGLTVDIEVKADSKEPEQEQEAQEEDIEENDNRQQSQDEVDPVLQRALQEL
ncbi:MAG: PDZ domain-containing protein [Candidatus Moranbacteria bacterium]|nr:PDZ domain-containing protein [Candidatus Moranbacteria bacterium]